MDPEPDQLEPPSASTGFETPGQQCLPSWEAGRTTAAVGCLPLGVSSSFGGSTFSLAEIAVATGTDREITPPYTVPNFVFVHPSRKPEDMKTANEENKQFDPGGKGGEPPPWKMGVLVVFSFLGRIWAWVPSDCALCFCLSVYLFYSVMFLSGDHFSAN